LLHYRRTAGTRAAQRTAEVIAPTASHATRACTVITHNLQTARPASARVNASTPWIEMTDASAPNIHAPGL
jgi:hypothetical protein